VSSKWSLSIRFPPPQSCIHPTNFAPNIHQYGSCYGHLSLWDSAPSPVGSACVASCHLKKYQGGTIIHQYGSCYGRLRLWDSAPSPVGSACVASCHLKKYQGGTIVCHVPAIPPQISCNSNLLNLLNLSFHLRY
jgi:hypothetical protein